MIYFAQNWDHAWHMLPAAMMAMIMVSSYE